MKRTFGSEEHRKKQRRGAAIILRAGQEIPCNPTTQTHFSYLFDEVDSAAELMEDGKTVPTATILGDAVSILWAKDEVPAYSNLFIDH
ncbi:hypothetical protein GX51_07787 [Blastomyces parvus]|uniref:Uncharacterized protein n=1 Tax=Blastomyces parvus TaxID=2060905 RepID=A0A2B7WIE7_9EURO|nr:hypothetical protein GX51_07787 [Blastomyces parvus]